MPVSETWRTLYCDPGEDFGWCIGKGLVLLAAGTEKMWVMSDAVWDSLDGTATFLDTDEYVREGQEGNNTGPIQRIVCEDWRIYPKEARRGALDWDPCRTARVIGSLTQAARRHSIPIVFQPAAIKSSAQAAGAEELYYRPLRENRHQNDAIQHFVYYTQVELLGMPSALDLANLPGQATVSE